MTSIATETTEETVATGPTGIEEVTIDGKSEEVTETVILAAPETTMTLAGDLAMMTDDLTEEAVTKIMVLRGIEATEVNDEAVEEKEEEEEEQAETTATENKPKKATVLPREGRLPQTMPFH